MHTCHHPDLVKGLNVLSEEEALHVSRVLRMKTGAQLRLVDGHGKVATGVLVDVGKKSARVEVEKVLVESQRPRGLTLVVSPTKQSDRFEWLIEKATELGVDKIIPVWTQRSERRIDKHARWQKVMVSATKQCQRIWMPVLAEACNVSDLFETHPELLSQQGAVAHCMQPWTMCRTGFHGATFKAPFSRPGSPLDPKETLPQRKCKRCTPKERLL